PDATALVNPWMAGGGEGAFFPHFCGTAVAYLLAWGLLRRCSGDDLPPAHRRFLVDALGLVAVATIADVMPLVGPNRALVTEGLRTLGNRGFPGLRELLRVSGVRGEPSAQDIGFRVAPRLNAAGRMGRTELALELLSTENGARAAELAGQLDALNLARRELELRETQALEAAVEVQRQRGDRVVFVGRQDAAFGVLGIVANRFLDATGLPSLVWAECGPGLARGSARGPQGHDLVELLDGASGLLDGYGGHARAAGFHFDPAKSGQLAAALRASAAKLPEPEPPTLEVDMEVGPSDLSSALVDQLARLAPFGEQNPEPVFLASGMTVASSRPIGDGSHLEMRLERNGSLARALAWRQADRWASVAPGDRVDAVFHAGVNAFRGRRSVEWTLRDLRSAT
ncbi:MAG: hypothetical protein ISR76_07005, partial [Planctomycetes bacterium]|nr:hypothetical protein [Planctomycetota bacterium]